MSNEQDIERWTELVAAEGRGRQLTELEQAFRAAIERERPELAAEASLWRALGQHGAGAAPAGGSSRDDDELCAAVLAGARGTTPPSALPRAARRLWPVLAAAACIALAFGVQTLLSAPPERPSRTAALESPSSAPMTSLPRASSHVLMIAPGSRAGLEPGACAAVTDDLHVCARTAALVEVVRSDDVIDLRLLAGTIEVLGADEPRPVSVETPAGTIFAEGAAFSVTLSEDLLGAQVSVLAGEVDLRAVAGVREPIAVERVRAPEVAAAPIGPRATPARPRPAGAQEADRSPEALLESAQRLLTAGDTAQAIAGYETLLRQHPRSVEARAAMVSLGNLLLLCDQPGPALRSFDRYLARGGELAEEALYGRINALHRLGRAAEGREASAQFLARHVDSLYAPRVRALAADD